MRNSRALLISAVLSLAGSALLATTVGGAGSAAATPAKPSHRSGKQLAVPSPTLAGGGTGALVKSVRASTQALRSAKVAHLDPSLYAIAGVAGDPANSGVQVSKHGTV